MKQRCLVVLLAGVEPQIRLCLVAVTLHTGDTGIVIPDSDGTTCVPEVFVLFLQSSQAKIPVLIAVLGPMQEHWPHAKPGQFHHCTQAGLHMLSNILNLKGS